jgi:hypothetical protein
MLLSTEEVKRIRSGRQIELCWPKMRGKVGKAYQVKTTRDHPPALELTLLTARETTLGQITFKDAKRLGARTTAEFRERFKPWNPERTVHLVQFALGNTTDEPRLLRAAAPQAPVCNATLTFIDFEDDGTEREWKVKCGRAFADNQSVCKCGKPRPSEREDDHGYTTSASQALRGTAEEVSGTYQAYLTAQASNGARTAARGHTEESCQMLRSVLNDMRSEANNIKIARNIKAFERQVAAMERKLAVA